MNWLGVANLERDIYGSGLPAQKVLSDEIPVLTSAGNRPMKQR